MGQPAEQEMESLARFPLENPNPVLRVSVEGVVLFANQAAVPLLAEHHSAVGLRAPDFFTQAATKALAAGVVAVLEEPCLDHTFSFDVVPVSDSGYVNLYGRDVTERRKMAQQVREREEELAAIYENAPLVMLVVDGERRVCKANKMAEQFIGGAAAGMLGRRGGEILHCLSAKDDPRGCGFGSQCQQCAVRRAVDETLTTGQGIRQVEANLRLVGKGETLDAAFLLSTARLEIRGQAHALIVFHDISVRKRAEETLRQAKDGLEVAVQQRTEELRQAAALAVAERRRFYDVLETLPAYVVLLSQDYHVPFANRFFRERFGESHGRRCYEYLFQRDEPCENCETFKVFKTHAPHRWEWIGPDGCNYDVNDYLFPDTDGTPLVLEMGIDVTERKKAEAALHELNATLERRITERTAELTKSEERYHTLFKSMTEGFSLHEIITDERGDPCDYRFLEINPAFERLTGLKRENLIGRRLREVLPNEDPQWIEQFGRVALTGQPAHFENYSPALNKYYQVLAYQPAPRQFAVVFSDVTERKRQEAELHRYNRTLRVLAKSNQAAMQATNEAEYLEAVCRILVEDCGHRMVWVGFAENDENKTVRPAASFGFEAGYLETLKISWADTERGRGPTGTTIRTGRPTFCQNMTTDPQFAPWRAEALKRGYASSAVFPLLFAGRAFGAINIYSYQPDAFTEDEVKLLSELADDLARGIMAFRMREAQRRTEEALRESEKLLRQAQVAAGAGTWNWDIPAGKLEWSEQLFQLFGLDPQNTAADFDVWKSVLHPDDRTLAEKKIEIAIADQVPLVSEYRIVRASGEVRWINALGNTHYDAAGKPLRLSGICLDVTERKQAEEALRRSEQRHQIMTRIAARLLAKRKPQRTIKDLCRDVMRFLDCHVFFNFMADSESGRLRLNACAGISAEEAHKIEWLDYGTAVCGCVARDGKRIVVEDVQHTEDPQATLVKGYGIQAYACHPLQAQGRTIGTLSFGTRTRPCFSIEDLSMMAAVAAIVSVAQERIEAELALRESRQDLSRAQAVAHVGSWRLNVQRNELWWSDETWRIFGVPAGTPLTYETFLSTVHPDDQRRVEEHWTEALRGRPYDIEHRIVVGEAIKWVRERAELELNSDGTLRGGFGTVQDITEQRQAEAQRHWLEEALVEVNANLEKKVEERTRELREANLKLQTEMQERLRAEEEKQRIAVLARSRERLAMLGELAPGIAHELRNPLQGVLGYLELTKIKSADRDDLRSLLDYMKVGLSEMDRLAAQLLDLSRPEEGPVTPMALEPLIERACGLIRVQMEKKKIALNIPSSANSPLVQVNPARLTDALLNLLKNAMDACDKHGEIIVRVQPHPQAKDMVELSVSDNGLGIPDEIRDKIFEPFFTTKPIGKGTGLGLPMVKKVVEGCGGSVAVSANPNSSGTTFTISLPIAAKKENNFDQNGRVVV
jgi:PAS domain S-box-containing protein